ncbi:golgin candidate 2-like isoform X1 [Zingiber officinale]|uniref:golgin candidate 2-like isoform X1 n=1 Tax=Zingiber officinale TaxID=94328 RepID=UPI001C4A8D0B|nr:golgin candidate 2-like isoform X1 [Zingiber officinale]
MANWISSKLKVAESILQQIDQQAAESLGKGDGSALPTGAVPEEISQKADQSRPLKYQLPKKASPPWHSPGVAAQVSAPPSPSVTRPSAADEDWTEILSSSDPVNSPLGTTLGGGSRKAAALPSSVDRGARKGSGGFVKPTGKAEVADRGESVADNAPGDGDRPSRRSSSLLDLTKELFKQEFHGGAADHSPSRSSDADSKILNVKKSADTGDGSNSKNMDVRPSGAHVQSRSSSESAEESSDSVSTSDSDEEIRLKREERRRKKEQMLAEKMAAVAAEAIRERENIVARLEGEKQSLEKILEEREKKQAQEASELQMSMFQTMEAVEREKRKHNSTMMEAITLLAELETVNAELATSLATAQITLEREVTKVGELRQQVELKEVAIEEHRRSILKIQQNSPSLDEAVSLQNSQIKQEILDAEYSFVCEKLSKLKDKAKMLEENVEMMRRGITRPTEIEIELKKRLEQLTDRLIQKQSQVESLSSEKATLVLRIETVSRLLDEDELPLQSTDLAQNSDATGSFEMADIESGIWRPSSSSFQPVIIRDKIRAGRRQLGSVLQQLDLVFSIGMVYLRRNQKAQVLAFLYLLCLHFWVFFILNSSSHISDGTKSGAVFSLETINNTSNP